MDNLVQECIICLNVVEEPLSNNFIKTCNCNLIVHEECLKEWLATSPICPLCRCLLLTKHTDQTNTFYSSPYIDPPVIQVDLDTLFNQYAEGRGNEDNQNIVNANAVRRIQRTKQRMYCLLLVAVCIIIIISKV
tara:strand:+ start:918 stop:1319 length:402 start_codon:yes stop_codon:yes gene_type:complete